MNKHIPLCAGIAALSTLLTVSVHAQADLPPPPPPIGPAPNAPQPAMPPILPPQDLPNLAPNTVPTLPETVAGPTQITVDAAAKRHNISPLIYSLSQATPAQLKALNMTLYTRQTGPGLVDFRTQQMGLPSSVFSADASPDTQVLRNRITRFLWDPYYGASTGPGAKLAASPALIPRLKSRLSAYPAGTKAGITNYDWGAENTLGGATAQADVLGIYGRESLDIATRTVPDAATPTFKAVQMYRNYDGKNSMFGSISVSDKTPDPDTLSSFASVRRSDGALTIMVINKALTTPTPVSLSVSHFAGTTANVWQLTSANTITHLPNTALRGGNLTTLPAQSITLFVVPAR